MVVLQQDLDEFEEFSRCGDEGNVLITNLEFPLVYDDFNLRFNNLGAFANTVVNGIGVYFLQTQEAMLIEKVKMNIKNVMASLLC